MQTQMGKKYYSYRLVTTYRDTQGKVRQAMLLNLGTDFNIPECDWKLLSDRVEQLLDKKQMQLFETELPKKIESTAQRMAKLIMKRQIKHEVEQSKRKALVSTEFVKPDYQTVDINSANDNDVRFIGGEYLGHHASKQLELKEILKEVGFNIKQSNIAIACIIARLVAPCSELRSHKYLIEKSALDELLDTDFSGLQLQQLYLASDRLLSHKDFIEESLYKRERELFQLDEIITLFDLTNTYFEGHPQHEGAKRGRSKEKRSDCELISLGVLLDSSGFPKKTKILPGNISEPSTLKDMISDMSTNATIIMDAGIATKENIEYLKDNEYKYILVRRDSALIMPEDCSQVLVKDTLHNKVTVSLVQLNATEIDLYCHSTAKEEKSKVFTNKMVQCFEEELHKLNMGLKYCDLQTDLSHIKPESTAIILNSGIIYTNGDKPLSMLIKLDTDSIELSDFTRNDELSQILQTNVEIKSILQKWTGQIRVKNKILTELCNLFKKYVEETKRNATREYHKILQKIGRLREKYKSVAFIYDIDVIPDNNKKNAIQIIYQKKDEQLKNKQSGVYCLTSNRTDLTASELWETYTMLTDLESAFKSMKSELGMRPIYHQLECRIDGHLFLSILAYHLLHTIRYQLKQKNLHYSWDSIRNIVSTQIRVTTSLDLKTGGVVKIRKTSTATPDQAEIYRALGIATSPLKLSKTYFNVGANNM